MMYILKTCYWKQNQKFALLNLNYLNLKTRLDKLKIFLADTDSHFPYERKFINNTSAVFRKYGY